MLIFKKVRYKNFISSGNNFTEIELNNVKSTLIVGESGAGKSVICDAIVFALYNKPYRQINKPSLVNSINEKDCVVEIEFSIGTQDFLVRRGVKPAIFEIFVNGILLRQDAHVTDYQKHLEKQILKLSYQSFIQIVVLGAANFTPFMRLLPKERRCIVESLLDIEIFSAMNVILKQKILENRNFQSECERNIDILLEKIELKSKYIQVLQNDEKAVLREKIGEIESHKSTLEDILADSAITKKEIDELKEKLVSDNDVQKKRNSFKDVYKKISSSLTRLVKEIDFFETNRDCPVCHQNIKEDFRLSEIDTKKKKKEELESGLNKSNLAIEKLDAVAAKLDAIRTQVRASENKLYLLEKESGFHRTKISKLEAELQVDSKQNKADIIISEEIVKKKLENELQLQEDGNRLALKNKIVYDTASILLKDSGIKAKIIKQYLPIINKFVNRYLSEMNFFVSFSIDENFDENIRSRGRDDLTYGNFSDGERQRIDLALLFTWRAVAQIKNSVHTNLLILDEVADSFLDNDATENVLELFKSDSFKNSNIFMISHKSTIENKFDEVIRIKKIKNFSVIV